MKLQHLVTAVFAIGLCCLLSAPIAMAQSQSVLISDPAQALVTAPTMAPPSKTSFWEKLERLQDDHQLQELVEEDLQKSFVIRAQIQDEVDRAFSHTTTLLNTLIGVLTFLPVLAAVSIWFIRRSVINQIVTETKRQLRQEVEKQLEAEVAEEFKQQTEAFKQEIEQLKTEFANQLAQLKTLFVDAQKEKDTIIQELSQITPSPLRDTASPETQQKIHALTQQLDQLKSSHAPLAFTAHDYIEQGKALHFEGRYEEALTLFDRAIAMEPETPKAWFSRGAVLAKLQHYDDAIASYDNAIDLKPDYLEAWFSRGSVLVKNQRLEEAIASYEKVTQLKPDFYLAAFGMARCYALQGAIELALEHLKQAIDLNAEKCVEMAKNDAAFDLLRDKATFQQLIAS